MRTIIFTHYSMIYKRCAASFQITRIYEKIHVAHHS